jgi:transposase
MLIAHKITLHPNNVQATYMGRAAGTARFSYNWALAEWQRQYAAHQADPSQPRPSQLSLRRQLNAVKREQFPWMLEVTKNAPQMAARRCTPGSSWATPSRISSPTVRVIQHSARKAGTTVSV